MRSTQLVHYGNSTVSPTTTRTPIFFPLDCLLDAFWLDLCTQPSSSGAFAGPSWLALLTGGIFNNGTSTQQSNVVGMLYQNYYDVGGVMNFGYHAGFGPGLALTIERGTVWQLECSPGAHNAIFLGEVTMLLRF
jgi:hypothetical protein